MIGNISLGISLENGRSRVPIPPAVMSAAYPRIPFCPDASRLDPECSLPTRYCPNGVEERAAYVNVMFSTWVQPRIHAAIGAHSNTRGICDDLACFGLKGRHAEEDARRGIFPPAFGPEILSEVKTVVRVLVTGGNGFIGSHLAERLEESGHSVTLFDLHFNGNTTSLQATTRSSTLPPSLGSPGDKWIRTPVGRRTSSAP